MQSAGARGSGWSVLLGTGTFVAVFAAICAGIVLARRSGPAFGLGEVARIGTVVGVLAVPILLWFLLVQASLRLVLARFGRGRLAAVAPYLAAGAVFGWLLGSTAHPRS